MDGKPTYLKEIFIGYCLTLFSIFFGLNLQTINVFGWLPRGMETLQSITQHGINIFMTLDFWYLVAGVIYMIVPVAFLSLFLFAYLHSEVGMPKSRRSMLYELALLTLAGAIGVPTLHVSRIFLTFLPLVDPALEQQLSHLTDNLKVRPEDWKPRAFPITQETLITGYYSIMIIFLYIVGFIILDHLSGKHFITTQLRKPIRKLLISIKKIKLKKARFRETHTLK